MIAARLEVARFLLESTAADLDEISRSAGFGNPQRCAITSGDVSA